MSYQDPNLLTPTRPEDRIDDRAAFTQDRRLQADPELPLRGGRARMPEIVLAALAAVAVLGIVLYGVNAPERPQGQPSDQQTTNAPVQPNQQQQAAQPQNKQQATTTGQGGEPKPQAQRSDPGQTTDQTKPPAASAQQGGQDVKPPAKGAQPPNKPAQ